MLMIAGLTGICIRMESKAAFTPDPGDARGTLRRFRRNVPRSYAEIDVLYMVKSASDVRNEQQ